MTYVAPKIVPSSDEDFRDALETLRSIDLSAVSIDQMKEEIGVPLKGHAISVPIFDPGIKLYRAPKMTSLPSSLAEIGAPPPDKVLSDQRCNRAGESLFYCSSARNAPFFEVHAQVRDHLVLSECRTTAKMTVNHVGLHPSNFRASSIHAKCANLGAASRRHWFLLERARSTSFSLLSLP